MRKQVAKAIANSDDTKRLARGRPGAMMVWFNDAGVMSKRWRPRLGGQFVADGPSRYVKQQDAIDAAQRVKDFAAQKLRLQNDKG